MLNALGLEILFKIYSIALYIPIRKMWLPFYIFKNIICEIIQIEK